MAPSKSSGVWRYFKQLNCDNAKCKLCLGNYSTKGRTTTSLKNHLRSKHYEQYEDILKNRFYAQDSKDEDGTETKLELSKDFKSECDEDDPNDEKLISFVEQYKCLYSKKHPNYKDTKQKRLIWTVIGKEIDKTGELCAKRWAILRDKYFRELKLEIALSESGAGYNSNWPFYDQMSFLREHITQRGQRYNIQIKNDVEEMELPMNNVCQSESVGMTEDFSWMVHSPQSVSQCPSPISIISATHANKKIKLADIDELKGNVKNLTSELTKVTESMTVKDDVVRGFCIMLQGCLLAMDHKTKMRTIKKINDVLFEAEDLE